MRQYDLVLFGATGFVGQIVCRYLAETLGGKDMTEPAVRWAIAGRSAQKLETLIASLPETARHLPYLLADASDAEALRSLCQQTKVVITTVGPYAFYGEPLLKACVEMGTDYCDLTGEVQWVRQMMSAYEDLAAQTGARIVHCCGFDSIPSDLGVYFLQQQARQKLGRPCTQIEMRLKDARGGFSGGTAASILNLIDAAAADPQLRQEVSNPYILCPKAAGDPAANRASTQSPIFVTVQEDAAFDNVWISPFVMAGINQPIVLRSQALMPHLYGDRLRYDEAILTADGPLGWMVAGGLQVAMAGFLYAATVPWLRRLLESTIVPAPGQGPSQQSRELGYYDLRFWGVTDTGDVIAVQVTGDRDPGYGSTAKILAQAGLCLALDCPKGEPGGGFWTPAAVFGQKAIDRLVQYSGLTFSVIADPNGDYAPFEQE